MADPILTFDPFPRGRQLRRDYIHILGFEFDGTACYRRGTRLGPDAIREASANIETYSPYFAADTVDVRAVDLGNLPLGSSQDVESSWAYANEHFQAIAGKLDIRAERVRFLVLGGEHSISYQPILHCIETFSDLVLLQLDAHADLRDGYQGFHYSHASVIRRLVDHFGEQHQLLQHGVRSGTREEFRWMRKEGTLVNEAGALQELLENLSPSRPIYLTLDLDYFDPAAMPGTGTPEPGGAFFPDFLPLLRVLATRRLVGADVVELAPNLDESGISEVLAAKCVRELVIAMNLSLEQANWEDEP